MLPGTKVLSGKNLSMLFSNPSAGVQPPPSSGFAALQAELHIDKFEYSPKVNSAKYASSATSGYMKNTSGVFEVDGSLDILIDAAGSLSGAAGSGGAGIGMQIDDFVDVNVYTTKTKTTPQFSGTIHIDSISKPIDTTSNKLKVSVKWSGEGQWIEN
ncbi:MAG: hypothetical protein ABSA16_18270 [Thermoguttaceae bacterium]|jgi:hypothetical protein